MSPRKEAPKKRRQKSQPAQAAAAAAPSLLLPGEALVLRTCDANMRAHGGFEWPSEGDVEAPDWKPRAECGNGLHGLLWGAGDGSLVNWAADAKWLVVAVQKDSIVDLSGKVKFPRGRVVFVGDGIEAAKLVGQYAPAGTPIVRGTATAGVRGTATAGYGGTATAGVRGTATAGDRGTATAGVRGTATAGDGGTATAGYGGTATAGYRGTATAGDGGTATAGDGGTATAGDGGTATAGYGGTATAGYGGTATAGYGGAISIRWYDPKREKYRLAIAEVGEDGIIANTAYVVEDGKLVPKKATP